MRPAVRAVGRVASPVWRTSQVLRPRRTLTLLGWHRIGQATDGLTTTWDDFRRHLDVLEQWGATVLGLDEAVEQLSSDTLPERAVALTFDDGYASVADTAWPELRRRGMPATLFAVSGYLDGRRTFPWDAGHDPRSDLIRLLPASGLRDVVADGLGVGSHTVSHRWLPALRQPEIEDEATGSRHQLEDLLQQPIGGFAYPMGGWGQAIRDAAERAGYRYAITVDRGRNAAGHDLLRLRRAFAFDRPEDVRRQLDGGYTWMRPLEDRRRRRVPTW